MDTSGPDFIVSELLSELKKENERKESQINSLHKTIKLIIIIAVAAILLTIGGCFIYMYQYDFSGYQEITTEKTAEGYFAIIDNEGNVIGYEGVEGIGESESSDYPESDLQ